MTTPLPAARPSALITTRSAPSRTSSSTNSSASGNCEKAPNAAVGTECRCISSLEKILLPSISAAAREQPNTARPRSRSKSASPATSGASGPTTTRSTFSASARSASFTISSALTGTQRATLSMPALPGAHNTSRTDGARDSAQASACSRPPPPTTSTFICENAAMRARRLA